MNYVVGGAPLYEAAAKAVSAVNTRSENLGTFDDVDRYSVDLYGAVQDEYLQCRHQQENRIRSDE
jgi:ABC-type transporter lipoprotein component MlaA